MTMTIGLIGRNPLRLSLGRLKKQPSRMQRGAAFLQDGPAKQGRDTLIGGIKDSAADHSARYHQGRPSPARKASGDRETDRSYNCGSCKGSIKRDAPLTHERLP